MTRSWRLFKNWCLQDLGNWQKQDVSRISNTWQDLGKPRSCWNHNKHWEDPILHTSWTNWCVQDLDHAQSGSWQDLDSIQYQFFSKVQLEILARPWQDLRYMYLAKSWQEKCKIVARFWQNCTSTKLNDFARPSEDDFAWSSSQIDVSFQIDDQLKHLYFAHLLSCRELL